MQAVTHAVIAAAGLGSRLGRGHPKCLVDFRGRTLLDRQLELLSHVEDVRVVVGFQEELVIAHARSLRSDLTFVRNPAYANTSTLVSYELGARYLTNPCVFMDADILFEATSFNAFIKRSAEVADTPLIAYTRTKTHDAVYVEVEAGAITSFSRDRFAEHEWANLAYLPPRYCEGGDGSVFAHLSRDLPLAAQEIVSHEIDRPEDYEAALNFDPLCVAAEQQGDLSRTAAHAVLSRAHDSLDVPEMRLGTLRRSSAER